MYALVAFFCTFYLRTFCSRGVAAVTEAWRGPIKGDPLKAEPTSDHESKLIFFK